VIENASLQGTPEVFDKRMCNAIRRVVVDNEWRTAVAMVFPVWGEPVDCFMSLDICERDIEQLVMALFSVEVKWVDHVLYVVRKDGITLMIPNSEVTLKGVPDKAIFEVFGFEIHEAITECPVHKRELEEEKGAIEEVSLISTKNGTIIKFAGERVTECVSLILTRNGAITNLSLGLERGLQIQNKLYT